MHRSWFLSMFILTFAGSALGAGAQPAVGAHQAAASCPDRAAGVAEAALAPAAAPRDQTQPAIAFNSHPDAQNLLLVWIEDRGTGDDIYAKRLFANGLPQGGPATRGWKVIRDEYETNRRAPPPGRRADPSLVYNPSREEYLLVYSEFGDESSGWDVYAIRVSAAGYGQGKPRRLAGGPGHQRRPDVAVVRDDVTRTEDYLVVWEDNVRDVDEIWAMRLQPNGIPVGNPYLVVRGTSNASDPTTNGTMLAWVDDRNGQGDIYSIRLRRGLPYGNESPVAQDVLEEFNPRFGGSGLIWNVFDPATGIDIMGIEIIENSRSPAGPGVIAVPAADQVAPDMENGILVFADNRSGDFDVYAVRVLSGGRIRARGHDYPVLSDR